MKIWRLWLLALFLTTSAPKAHEGHEIPGALPPAPNGGVLEEAKQKGALHPSGARLFFEATHKEGKLKIYPLLLTKDAFTPLAPKEMKDVQVKVELPRKKTSEVLKVSAAGEIFEAPYDSKGVNRFIVHVSAVHDKALKTAKLQIEKN